MKYRVSIVIRDEENRDVIYATAISLDKRTVVGIGDVLHNDTARRMTATLINTACTQACNVLAAHSDRPVCDDQCSCNTY